MILGVLYWFGVTIGAYVLWRLWLKLCIAIIEGKFDK